MKMRCDRVFWDYFTRGRDGVCQVKARNLSIVIFIVRVFCRIFLHVPKHIYSCLWSLILLVRSFVKCNVLYNVVCEDIPWGTKVRDCRISKYQINSDILRFWDLDIFMILFWYYQMIVDISFVCHLTVIFWYYHDILMYQNIKITVRFRDFAMLILSWYFDIIKCLLIYLSYAISRWYFDIIMIFWYIKISN